MHSKARFTSGRPTGGLAAWVRNDVYKSYDVQTVKNTEYIQTFKLQPKIDKDTVATLNITNAYCRPVQREFERNDFYEGTKQAITQNTIRLLVGDLNAHHPITGSFKTNLNGKKCARGFQDVIVTEVGRARLIAFIHRHKKHVHLLNTGHTGPNEARLFIEQVLRMSKLHKGSTGPLRACDHGLSFPELYSADPSEQPHFTFDNHFQHNDLVDWLLPFDGVGMLSTAHAGITSSVGCAASPLV